MKIINRETFLKMPAGTLFAKYEPCLFDQLCIKGETWGNDFLVQQITSAIDVNDSGEFGDALQDSELSGSSIPMDFECEGRDGCFDDDQLFAIFEIADTCGLILRLNKAVAMATLS